MTERLFHPSIVSSDLKQILAERPYRLWTLHRNGFGSLLDLRHLVAFSLDSTALGWDNWRTVQLLDRGRTLRWAQGQTLDLTTLRHELRRPPADRSIQVLRHMPRSEYYRPLRHGLPSRSAPFAPVSPAILLDRYGIDQATLTTVTGQYAAPPGLLYRRLLDLVLALGQALAIPDAGVRELLHWRWPLRRRGAATPFEAITLGQLPLVEQTLYPGSPDGHP